MLGQGVPQRRGYGGPGLAGRVYAGRIGGWRAVTVRELNWLRRGGQAGQVLVVTRGSFVPGGSDATQYGRVVPLDRNGVRSPFAAVIKDGKLDTEVRLNAQAIEDAWASMSFAARTVLEDRFKDLGGVRAALTSTAGGGQEPPPRLWARLRRRQSAANTTPPVERTAKFLLSEQIPDTTRSSITALVPGLLGMSSTAALWVVTAGYLGLRLAGRLGTGQREVLRNRASTIANLLYVERDHTGRPVVLNQAEIDAHMALHPTSDPAPPEPVPLYGFFRTSEAGGYEFRSAVEFGWKPGGELPSVGSWLPLTDPVLAERQHLDQLVEFRSAGLQARNASRISLTERVIKHQDAGAAASSSHARISHRFVASALAVTLMFKGRRLDRQILKEFPPDSLEWETAQLRLAHSTGAWRRAL